MKKSKGSKPSIAKRRHWAKLIADWRKSGLSRKDFCQKHKISPCTFDYYRYRAGLDPKVKTRKKSAFVKFAAAPLLKTSTVRAVVHLPGGISVDIPELDLCMLKALA